MEVREEHSSEIQLLKICPINVDDKKQFFNPDCSLEILVDNVRKRCQCPSDCGIAVIDDKYSIINLTDEISTCSCSNLFMDRATYVLLAVDKRDYSSTKFIPLLDNIDPDLAAKLDVLSSKGCSDQKHFRNWSKTRPMKQISVPPTGQGKRKQSAVSTSGFLKRKAAKT